jgi:predicted Zn-dependent peptidase
MSGSDPGEVYSSRLANGAALAVQAMPAAQTVSIGAWLRCGTRDEPSPAHGVAHFLEHMVFKGSATRDTLALARAFESLGGQCDAYTTHDATCYSVQVLPEHVDAGVELLADLLAAATLDPEAVETEKQVVAEEIHECDDNPADQVQEVCARKAWGDHPLARPVLGTLDSVNGLSAERVRTFRDQFYTGERLLLAAAGAVDVAALEESAERWLGGMPAVGEPLAREAPVFHPGPAAKRAPTDQVHLCLGVVTGGAADPDRHALWVIDMLLGATMSSRLFQEVRERRGLAYQVSSSWQAQSDAGLLAVDAVASPEKVGELLAVVRDEVAAVVDGGVPEADLAWVKDYARTTVRLAAESTATHMNRVARGFFYEGRNVSLAELLAAIEALDVDDVRRAAQRVFGAREWVLAAVGPVSARKADKWFEVLKP